MATQIVYGVTRASPAAGSGPGWESPPTAELHVHVEGTLEPEAGVAGR